MGKKIIVTAVTMFAFAFGTTLRSNAGTETVEPYRAPARYNYAPPPPRPVLYVPPPVFGVAFGPGFGFGARRVVVVRGHRFHRHPVFRGPHRHWR
jgi:hypothetical protein